MKRFYFCWLDEMIVIVGDGGDGWTPRDLQCMSTMQAVLCRSAGGPEAMTVEEVSIPAPRHGEVPTTSYRPMVVGGGGGERTTTI